jgi:hypothetical protein
MSKRQAVGPARKADGEPSQATERYVQAVKIAPNGSVLAKVWSSALHHATWIKVVLPPNMTLEAAAAAAAKGWLLARPRHAGMVLAIER